MSIFSTILDKLGLGKDKKEDEKEKEVHAAPKPDVPYTPPPSSASTAQAAPKPMASAPKPAPAAPKPRPVAPRPVAVKHEEAGVNAPAVDRPAPIVLNKPEPKPEAVPLVDVKAKLEAMADKMDPKPNWRNSIADLLFLLGMDHSYKARKELAIELGCPEKLMDDSAQMNIWLHKTVLHKIAENGGSLPKELLDN